MVARFLHLTESGNLVKPGDYDKLCMCNVIPRATTKYLCKETYSKAIQIK